MIVPHVEPISIGDIRRFLRGSKVKGQCSECGSNTWSVVGEDPSNVPAIPIINDNQTPTSANVPLLLVTCGSCGNTLFFSRKIVITWLASNPE